MRGFDNREARRRGQEMLVLNIVKSWTKKGSITDGAGHRRSMLGLGLCRTITDYHRPGSRSEQSGREQLPGLDGGRGYADGVGI